MAESKQIDDLKFIKDNYGEELMKISRSLFPTILETPGRLSQILTDTFAPSRSIAKDFKNDPDFADNFKKIIYSKFNQPKKDVVSTGKSAVELFKEAGYTLYPECQSEANIQAFRHFYYRKYGKKITYDPSKTIEPYLMPEELCTFGGNRLDTNRVWFAVKDGAENLKRENFKNPDRQDEYGTSVLSIQFTRGKSSEISIKNRYNHAVINPDATFSNNLDNIIPGLAEAMARDYDLNPIPLSNYDFDNYVMANDGKYYRFNREINNVYYCENNVIVDNFKPKQLPKDKYIFATIL